MDFCERLSNLLKDNKMTAKQLTELLNISTTSVTDWKRGKSSPSISTLIGISKIFHVSIDFLLNGIEFSNNLNSNLDENTCILVDIFSQLSTLNKERVLERAETLLETQQTKKQKFAHYHTQNGEEAATLTEDLA